MNETDRQTDYDVVIIGGGMVGASLACALGNTPLRIAVIEAAPAGAELQPSFDARTVALAYGSRVIFDSLGLWQAIEALGVTPIKKIHVSDRGHLGSTHLDCESEGVDALGYVVETRVLGEVLRTAMGKSGNVSVYCPASLEQLVVDDNRAQLVINRQGQTETLSTRLLVGADGGDSQVRQLLGMRTFRIDYGQYAVIANVATDRPHRNIAYERFTATGPMALLPSHDVQDKQDIYALVWTVSESERDSVLALDDSGFLHQLQQRFGQRAGRFVKAGSRHVYPLGWMQSREHVRPRAAIIGNAAHTLHPVAGQGFNLGLRDVAVLAQVIVDAVKAGRDPGELQLLQTYASWRKRDQLQTALMTDGIVRVFSSAFPPLALVRNIGLTLFDILPPLKHTLARHAMGFIGKLPRPARGLHL